METSTLAVGDVVAVYPLRPVPMDPFNRWNRAHVRKATFMDRDANVARVVYDGGIDAETVTARQVVAPWDAWVPVVTERERAETAQADAVAAQVTREATALASAQKIYPGAAITGGNVVIPIEEWLGHDPVD